MVTLSYGPAVPDPGPELSGTGSVPEAGAVADSFISILLWRSFRRIRVARSRARSRRRASRFGSGTAFWKTCVCIKSFSCGCAANAASLYGILLWPANPHGNVLLLELPPSSNRFMSRMIDSAMATVAADVAQWALPLLRSPTIPAPPLWVRSMIAAKRSGLTSC
jgi:hypothetical protein